MGGLHSVFVTGTLCFSADGLIVLSKHNYPASWNDADTSLDFRAKLLDNNLNPDSRYFGIADGAFPCGDDMCGRIMTPLKEGDLARLVPSVRAIAHHKSKAITFIRQSIEWGMGSVEKVFHRLALPLPYDVQQRRIRPDNLFRLSNHRVLTVEISAIRTTFIGAPKPVVTLSSEDAELLRDAYDPDVVPRDLPEVPTEWGTGSVVDTGAGPLTPDIVDDADPSKLSDTATSSMAITGDTGHGGWFCRRSDGASQLIGSSLRPSWSASLVEGSHPSSQEIGRLDWAPSPAPSKVACPRGQPARLGRHG
ncbi:unnamed protein product [Phytophthora fragariaefolia]|uniref:Unnamed protein product n=1 Tax=Phytophthora fragariaefolia TaxID=1490495 RepID=A0A9W6TJN3_9STRA|nr:unnamed protein product [Phytophthora fragariaefolia]